MSWLWSRLNNKKTLIGTSFLFVAAFINQVLIGQWEISAAFLPKASATFEWFGMSFGGVGMAHKVAKYRKLEIANGAARTKATISK